MRWIVLVAAIFLAGCAESAAEKAENEYRIAETAVIDPARKKCAAARKAAEAYAAEGDQKSYSQWEMTAYNDCFEAGRY